MAPEQKKRVALSDHGEGRGQSVHLTRSMIEKAGLDPDADLEANRTVLGEGNGSIRIRIYPASQE